MNRRGSGRPSTASMTAMAAGWNAFWRTKSTVIGKRCPSAKSAAFACPALGKPLKDQNLSRQLKKQEYQDSCDRNVVEGLFGTGKTAYGLGRISVRLEDTTRCVIGVALLLGNLMKRLRLSLFQVSRLESIE